MGKYLFIFLLLLITSCGNTSGSNTLKHDYDEVREYHISYLDVFNIDKGEYYIYYYQVDCYYCHGIKSKVIEFALRDDIHLYFINIEKDEGFLSYKVEDTIGTSDPMYAFCFRTPQLSKVIEHKISETYIGDKDILIIIE